MLGGVQCDLERQVARAANSAKIIIAKGGIERISCAACDLIAKVRVLPRKSFSSRVLSWKDSWI